MVVLFEIGHVICEVEGLTLLHWNSCLISSLNCEFFRHCSGFLSGVRSHSEQTRSPAVASLHIRPRDIGEFET